MTDPLSRAWITLITLSGLAATVSFAVDSGLDRRIAGAVILLLALMKARVILSRYLGLSEAPSWRRGFNMTLTLFCLLMLGLYLVPSFI